MKDVFEDTRSILEPAGALAVAGVKAYVESERRAAANAGGGHLRRQHQLRPAALRRRTRRTGRAPRGDPRRDHPRAPRQLQRILPAARARATSPSSTIAIADPTRAHVFVGVEVRDRDETAQLLAQLEPGLSDARPDRQRDGQAARSPSGRRPRAAANEILYRFEFPGAPGRADALPRQHRPDWNISLFHYRNHGADYGRVLVGIQVPPADRRAFRDFLRRLGYPNWDETRNAAIPPLPERVRRRCPTAAEGVTTARVDPHRTCRVRPRIVFSAAVAAAALAGICTSLSAGAAGPSLPPLPARWPSTLQLGLADSPGGAAALRRRRLSGSATSTSPEASTPARAGRPGTRPDRS